MGASLAVSFHNVYETLAISAPTVADALLGRVSKSVCDERLDRWSRACLRNAHIRLDVRGREYLPGAQAHQGGTPAPASPAPLASTYLVMSNHQSLYDIPVLFQVVGPNIRMITKKELFRVPVFGGALEASGFIAIDRSNRNAAMRSLKRASDLLASGTHVWVAPEGTRSPTDEMLPFKKGAFYLAFEANLPILPVTLRGTRDVLPSNAWASRLGAAVHVTLHEPIDPRSFSARGKPGRDELMAHVRRVLESAL